MGQTWLVFMRVVTCALQGTGSLTLPLRSFWSRAARGLSRLTAQSLFMPSGEHTHLPHRNGSTAQRSSHHNLPFHTYTC